MKVTVGHFQIDKNRKLIASISALQVIKKKKRAPLAQMKNNNNLNLQE